MVEIIVQFKVPYCAMKSSVHSVVADQLPAEKKCACLKLRVYYIGLYTYKNVITGMH